MWRLNELVETKEVVESRNAKVGRQLPRWSIASNPGLFYTRIHNTRVNHSLLVGICTLTRKVLFGSRYRTKRQFESLWISFYTQGSSTQVAYRSDLAMIRVEVTSLLTTMPDPTSQSNYLNISTTHVHFDWAVDFESQTIYGSATHKLTAKSDGVDEVV